jgi:prephenate dehydratase
LDVVESQVLDIKMFKSQAVEIRQKVLTAQQDLLVKVGTIQNHFQTIDQVLENISLREKEIGAARVAFQDVAIATAKIEMVGSSKLSIAEQTRGNILLKVWAQNISESRGRANEVMNSCEETFALISRSLLSLDKEDTAGTLGKINIANTYWISKKTWRKSKWR